MKNTKRTTNPTIKYVLQFLTGLIILIAAILIHQKPSAAADVVVYKSATCGCCNSWIKHLQQNGFSTEAHNANNMQLVKNNMGVPPKLTSCHTAKVGGYVIEGHVPADVITRLLKEKPAIKGVTVPGMPMGSPGMEGPRKDPYNVVSFDEDGNLSIYARR